MQYVPRKKLLNRFLRELTLVLFLHAKVLAAPVISEFMVSNDVTLADKDGDYSDWIEIYNPDTVPVDMSGWHLTDDASQLTKWTFPSVTIPADGYLIVFASGKNSSIPGNELHTNFKLKSQGEYLALVQPDGSNMVSQFDPYPVQQTDVSYGIPQNVEERLTLVNEGASLRYHVPTGAVPNWNTPLFDDSAWSMATSGVGYERDGSNSYDPFIASDIESLTYNINSSIYLRYYFSVTDHTEAAALTFLGKYDDGFIAYLNGQPIASDNIIGTPDWNSSAASSQEANLVIFQSWDVSAQLSHLVSGNNVLAIQLLNQSKTSSDLLMIPKLEMTRNVDKTNADYKYFVDATPGTINNGAVGEPSGEVLVSEPSGVKTATISVSLMPPSPGAVVRYTMDGSDPSESSNIYENNPITVSDPSRLRARAYEEGKVRGPIAAADYSFIDTSLLGYIADVPVIVMDNFGAGSYPNKGRNSDGRNIVQVSRQSNVMSIYGVAANSQPFSQPAEVESRAGCRARGSSSINFPRKSLSVEFWKENKNEDRSLTPFGMAAEADWVLYAPNPTYDRTLIHNPVSFGFAKKIGALYPNNKVVVVFQNTDGGKITSSDLEGVYVFMEKIERNRMGMDFKKMNTTGTTGGWRVSIDRLPAIPEGMSADTVQPNFHAAGPNGILEIFDDQDGDSSPQPEDDVSEFYHSFLNFANPDGYEIQTLQRNTIQADVRAMDSAVWADNYESHLDADSWARHYAVNNFARNNDALVLSTHIYRESPSAKIKMGPVWDFDRAYTQNGSATSSPLIYSDRDWHQGLIQNIDFKQTLQDAWQEARRTTATNSALESLVDDSVAGLRPDQISASGLGFSSWQGRVSDMRNWVVARADFLDAQYEPLPSVSPVTELFSSSVSVAMAPASSGTVYYTTDGTDPRMPGGAISLSANAFSPLMISQRTRIIARTLEGLSWSGKIERNYYRAEDLPQLVISEICYHPADPTSAETAMGYDDADDFEFIEIQNIGSNTVDLTSLVLAGGISFDFTMATSTDLAAGSRILVVKNLPAFEARYGSGLPVIGSYGGALNNAGDQIILADALLDIDIQNFTYDDEPPWPTCADGQGYSLVLRQPYTNPNHSAVANWRCSGLPSGNPGTQDAVSAFVGNSSVDDDGDGVDALIEHFLGTSDNDASMGNGLINVSLIVLPDDGLEYPVFKVRYRVGADDVIPNGMWSQDLLTWSAMPSEIVQHSHTLHGDGTATVVWRSIQPSSLGGNQFFRLQVTLP